MGPTVERLLGVPNQRLSKQGDVRYGSHGSLSIDLETGTFYDHEAKQGGGCLLYTSDAADE